jgi:hypothetical protein
MQPHEHTRKCRVYSDEPVTGNQVFLSSCACSPSGRFDLSFICSVKNDLEAQFGKFLQQNSRHLHHKTTMQFVFILLCSAVFLFLLFCVWSSLVVFFFLACVCVCVCFVLFLRVFLSSSSVFELASSVC